MSGILNSDDWDEITADMDSIRGDNEVSLTLRRGEVDLPVVLARVTGKRSQGRMYRTQTGTESQVNIHVLFPVGTDVQPDDRFTYNGRLYRIVSIQPNTRAKVGADAIQEE